MFGKDSEHYKVITTYTPYSESYIMYNTEEGFNKTKGELRKIISYAIETIKAGGLIEKRNFLQRISEGWLITILTFGIPSLLAIGAAGSKYLSDVQNIKLKDDLQKCHDSLYVFSSSKLRNTIAHKELNSATESQQNVHY